MLNLCLRFFCESLDYESCFVEYILEGPKCSTCFYYRSFYFYTLFCKVGLKISFDLVVLCSIECILVQEWGRIVAGASVYCAKG